MKDHRKKMTEALDECKGKVVKRIYEPSHPKYFPDLVVEFTDGTELHLLAQEGGGIDIV